MKIKRESYVKHLFLLFVIFELLVMFASGMMSYNPVIIVYGNFAIEIIATIYAVSLHGFKLRIPRNDRIWLSIFGICQITMFFITSFQKDIVFFDIHKLLMCLGMIFCSCYVVSGEECSPKLLDKFCNLVLLFGVFATVYNIVINTNILKTGNLSIIMYYTWSFRAFFPARAAYGSFLAVCALIALMRAEQSKKKGMLFLFIWFAVNILITAARAQCLALILGAIIYLLHSKKYRKFVFCGIAIGIVYLLIMGIGWFDEIKETYFMFFDHSRGRDTDITTGRLELWIQAFKNMGIANWLVGTGIGSKDTVMALNNVSILGERLSSFHSGYIDLFFESGLLGILIWGRSITRTIKNIKSVCPDNIKHFFVSVIVIFLVSCVFDSCYMIYTTDTMAAFSTLFAIALPNTVANYYARHRDEQNALIEI